MGVERTSEIDSKESVASEELNREQSHLLTQPLHPPPHQPNERSQNVTEDSNTSFRRVKFPPAIPNPRKLKGNLTIFSEAKDPGPLQLTHLQPHHMASAYEFSFHFIHLICSWITFCNQFLLLIKTGDRVKVSISTKSGKVCAESLLIKINLMHTTWY